MNFMDVEVYALAISLVFPIAAYWLAHKKK